MPPRVVYLGPVGAFCHEAAREYFTDHAELIAAPSIPAVFEAVTRGEGEWGIVPIENSIEGGVTFTQDTLLETPLALCGEVMVDIEQCLLTNAPDPLRLERVYSHPQGLAQCRKWLAAHLPHAAQMPTGSTVQAAHRRQSRAGAEAAEPSGPCQMSPAQ